MSPLDGLAYKNWHHGSPEGRLASLQNLENQTAVSEGREARKVEKMGWKDSAFSGNAGYFDSSKPDKIFINDKLLRQNDPEIAVRTVAHEGRHAYQYDCVKEPDKHPEISQEMKARWAENSKPENYISLKSNPVLYRLQPIEADAYRFEDKVMDQLYTSKQTGLNIDKARPQDVASKGGNDDLISRDKSSDESPNRAEIMKRFEKSAVPKAPPPPPPSQSKGFTM